MKLSSKDNIDYEIRLDKHEVLFSKQNTLKLIISKINETPDDIDSMSNLDTYVKTKLEESDELMNARIHMRESRIKRLESE